MEQGRGLRGREALLTKQYEGPRKRLVQGRLHDGDRLLYHNEPIWRDGELVGRVTSGMYGHTVKASLAMGYVENINSLADNAWVLSGNYEIEIACERFGAELSLVPFYDPKSLRVRM